jgi:hypothetical protein
MESKRSLIHRLVRILGVLLLSLDGEPRKLTETEIDSDEV